MVGGRKITNVRKNACKISNLIKFIEPKVEFPETQMCEVQLKSWRAVQNQAKMEETSLTLYGTGKE